MTHTEQLEQSWRNLESDVQRRLRSANARATALVSERHRRHPPERRFPSVASADEIAQWAEAGAYASVLDLIHTAMRELGLRYD